MLLFDLYIGEDFHTSRSENAWDFGLTEEAVTDKITRILAEMSAAATTDLVIVIRKEED